MSLRLVETRTHIVAVEDGQVTGTIGVLSQPGRVGLVFPPELDGASAGTPGALIDAAVRRLERAGAAFAQLTLPTESLALAAPFQEQGFSLLTDAIVLERSLSPGLEVSPEHPLTSIPCDPEQDASRVAGLLASINSETLDCPELDVLRTPEDLLTAHRNHSREGRARWRRYEADGNDVGVVLGTTAEDSEAWEILYFGVVPEQRGQGFGRSLLEQFLAEAAQETSRIRTGIDSRNHYAARAYESCGFQPSGCLRVWVHPLAAPA